MNPLDYIILGGVIIAVIFAVVWSIRQKKQENSCYGCGSCSSENNCPEYHN